MAANLSDKIRGVLSRHVRIFGSESDGLDYHAGVDRTNLSLKVQDALHSNTHRGIVYEPYYRADGVANDASIEILVQVHDRYPMHCRPSFKSSGAAELAVFESPTITDVGTALTAHNRNRRAFAPAANCTVTHSPSHSADGNEFLFEPEYGTSGLFGASTGGGESNGFNERVLREGFDYLFRVTNRAGSAESLWLALVFYEQELKL